ncbi:MAG: phage Gp37/Gp68 family protein [Rhodocyclaceae bacterium]|nr:phage Gp37/Gp68 family protein [Rhodocyclaceae bacterium]
MADKSAIEWTDATWSPVTGCDPISAGCKHCYAKREVEIRWSKNPKSEWFGRPFNDVRCHPEKLAGARSPLAWKRPRRIFVCPRADLFHDAVPTGFIRAVFDFMAACPQHTFQVLTKHAARMQFLLWSEFDWQPLPNVWIGVSVEDQAAADERISLLLQTPAAVRWVSAEPLLGSLDLVNPLGLWRVGAKRLLAPNHYPDINWVVAGGESGPNARPMHPSWARSLRDQCTKAGVPFLFKQWGEWAPHPEIKDAGGSLFHCFDDGTWMQRDGKKAAGRLLDGVLHDEYPEARR